MKIETTCDRRKFIKGAAIASGLAALLGLIRPASAKETKQPLPQEESKQSLREQFPSR